MYRTFDSEGVQVPNLLKLHNLPKRTWVHFTNNATKAWREEWGSDDFDKRKVESEHHLFLGLADCYLLAPWCHLG